MKNLVKFPTKIHGWFAVAFSSDLRWPGRILSRRVMGEDWIVYRTEDGIPVVMQEHCPHVGASLAGGKIVGDAVECPFHHLQFAPSGACVNTYPGCKPPKIRTRTLPVEERHGVILAFFGGEEPWELPPSLPELPEGKSWGPLARRTRTFKVHIQDTGENIVDTAHFRCVHGYEIVPLSVTTEGPLLTGEFKVLRGSGGILSSKPLEFDLKIEAYGFGYHLVTVYSPKLGHVRHRVMNTLVEDRVTLTRYATQWSYPTWTRYLGGRLLNYLGNQLVLRGILHDTMQDRAIWDRKVSLSPPGLVDGDGPIGLYRKWAKQFYDKTKLEVI